MVATEIPKAVPAQSQTGARIENRDWSKLTLGQRIQHVELEGYVVIPDLLSRDQIARLKEETARLETRGMDYSERQRTSREVHRAGGEIAKLPGNAATLAFLSELFGDDLIVMSYSYARSEPGHPGISLHTDGQPYGSQIFGYEGSCPVLVRVLYYLDDLTPEISPFRVVPRSHLSLHADGNPYLRFEAHSEELMVPVKAGGAVFLNHKCFHGNFPNTGHQPREMLAIAYRPAWAGPVPLGEVKPWEPEGLAELPENVRPLFTDRNTRRGDFFGANRPTNMRSEAPGISPSRWERT